jgi:hypothetical protein
MMIRTLLVLVSLQGDLFAEILSPLCADGSVSLSCGLEQSLESFTLESSSRRTLGRTKGGERLGESSHSGRWGKMLRSVTVVINGSERRGSRERRVRFGLRFWRRCRRDRDHWNGRIEERHVERYS